MALKRGYSHATFEVNYRQLSKEGKPHAQALAIAYKAARESYWHKFPQGACPGWMVHPGESRLNPKLKPRKNPISALHALSAATSAHYLATQAKPKRKRNPCGCRKPNPADLYALELKVDSDRKWNKIVTSHAAMPASEISAYISMYAMDRQLSPGFFDARVIDQSGIVVWERNSDRSENAKTRRKNPVPPSKHVQRRDAAKLYKNFTGHDALDEVVIDKPELPDVMLVVGDIDGIMYTTVRDGVTEKYVHQFKKKARPLFCVSPDGTQIHLMGGEYDFTERGIVDRS